MEMSASPHPWIVHESHMPDSLRQWACRLREYAPGLDGRRHGKRRTDNHLFWGELRSARWLVGVVFVVAVFAELSFWQGLSSIHWIDSEEVAWRTGALLGGLLLILGSGLWFWRRAQSSFGHYWYVTPRYVVASCYNHVKIYPAVLVTKVETGTYHEGLVRVHVAGFVLHLRTAGWPSALALSQQLQRWFGEKREAVVPPAEDVDYPLPDGIDWEKWHRPHPSRRGFWGSLGFVFVVGLLFWHWLQVDVLPTYKRKELHRKAEQFLQATTPVSVQGETSLQGLDTLQMEEWMYQTLQQKIQGYEDQLQHPDLLFQPVSLFRTWHEQLQRYLVAFPAGKYRVHVLNDVILLDHRLFAYAKGRLDDTLALYKELFGETGLHSSVWEQTMLERLPRTAAYVEKNFSCTETEIRAHACLRDTWLALLRALDQKHTRTVAVSFSFRTPKLLSFLTEKIQKKEVYPEGLVGFDTYPAAFSNEIETRAQQQMIKALTHWIPGVWLDVVEAKGTETSGRQVLLQATGDFFLVAPSREVQQSLPGIRLPYRLGWLGTLMGQNIARFSFFSEEKSPHYYYDPFLKSLIVSEDLFEDLLQDLRYSTDRKRRKPAELGTTDPA